MSDGIALTPEEQRIFGPLFQKYEEDGSMIILGDHMRPLMQRSGLSAAQLGQIWQVADPENRGFLDQAGFVRSLRMVYHVQHGQQLSPRLANIPAGMPALDRSTQLQSPPVQGANLHPNLVQNSTGGSLHSQATGGIPVLTRAEKQRFEPLFDRAKSNDGLIDGQAAKDIFLKARLPAETLGRIWALVDVKERGRLTRNEFILAMHLIQCTISQNLSQIPAALPDSWKPWLEQGAPTDVSTAPSAPSAPSAIPKGQDDWTIKPEEKQRFDGIFDSLDSNHDGILAAQEAVPLFTQSKLSEDVLARIWDLADTQGRGQLDHKDFALAMFLMKMTLNGQPLPDSLPQHLVESASQTLPPNGVGQGGAAKSEVPPSVPVSRKESVQAPMPTVNHSNAGSKPALSQQSTSSLNDLVSLDDAFFKPLEPAKQEPAPQPKEKSFVPSSHFGQTLMSGSGAPPPVQSPRATGTSTRDITSGNVQSPVSTGKEKPVSVQEDSEKATRDQLQQSLKEKAVLGDQLEKVQGERTSLEKHLVALRQQYDQEASAVHRIQQQLRQTRDEIAQLEKDTKLRASGLDALQKQRQQDQSALAELIQRREELESQKSEHSRTLDGFSKMSEEHRSQTENQRKMITEHESAIQQVLLDIEAAKARASQDVEATKSAYAQVEEHRHRREQVEAEMVEINRLVDARARERAEAEAREREAAVALGQAGKETEEAKKKLNQPHVGGQDQKPLGKSVSTDLPSSGLSAAAAGVLAAGAATVGAALGRRESPVSAVPDSKEPSSAAEPPNYAASADGSVAAAPSFTESSRTSPPGSEFGAGGATAPWNLPMGRPLSASSSVANNAPQSVRGDLDETETEQETREPSVRNEDGDSFEFVDAKEGNSSSRDGDQSSSDDEAPASAIPKQYAPSTAQPSDPSPRVDEFDEGFDDLVDAKPDEEGVDVGLPASESPSAWPPQSQPDNAGPDEWQQLFASTQPTEQEPGAPVQELINMGFDPDAAREALERADGNLADAANLLLSQ